MSPQICPFLGLRKDADTAMEFASRGNYCYHARPIGAVQLDHQREFCLNEHHVDCPVFRRSELTPLPPEIVYKPALPPALRWAAIGALGLFLLMALFSWIGLGDVLAGLGQPPAAGEVAAYERSPLMNASATPTQTGTSDLLFSFTVSPNPTFAACTPPRGWELYVAKPTDSLLRLSIIYQLTVEELQQANCMGDSTIIRPGDRLYVPVLPTVTPSPTVTPTRRVILLPTATEPDHSDDEPPPPPTATQPPPTKQPSATSPPPTQQPPATQPPPTATTVPPTQPPAPTDAETPGSVDPTPPDNQSGGPGGDETGAGDLIGGVLDLVEPILRPILD